MKNPQQPPRFIVHLDMDAFFAAVEQRDDPSLRGKPVIIGADPKKGKGRGVVSTCSYEARKFGVHSAMPISIAYQKCPQGIFLRGSFDKYREASGKVFSTLKDFTPHIQPISIDEAFLDITSTHHLFGTPKATCLQMKDRIKKEVNLTASIGLGPTKMAAKIASDLKKPDGFVEVTPEKLLQFLWPLDIRRIWGLGKKSEKMLRQMGIKTIGDLAKYDTDELMTVFGKWGIHYWELANGHDPGEVTIDREVKSISNERTFSEDVADAQKIESALMYLSEKVSYRLRKKNLQGKTVTLKIRLEGFYTFTRASTLDDPTNFVDLIYKEIIKLFKKFDSKGKKIRLVGVKVSNLSTGKAPESFLFPEYDNEKLENLHEATDDINERFGTQIVHRAKDML